MSQNIVPCHEIRIFPDGSAENQFFLSIFDPDGNELTKIVSEGNKMAFDKAMVQLHQWMDDNVRTPLDPDMDHHEMWNALGRRQLDALPVIEFQHKRKWLTDQQMIWYMQMREGRHPGSTKTLMEQKPDP